MTRVKYGAGLVLVLGLVMSNGIAMAQSREQTACVDCEVRFTVAATPEGSRLRAEGVGIVIDKRAGRDGLRINVSAAADAVEIVASLDGIVTIGRRGNTIVVKPESVLSDYETSVKALTANSAAVDGLQRMVLALRHNDRPESTSILASFALLRALHGDDTGNALLAQRSLKRPGPGVLPIAAQTRAGDTVSDCWDEYERALSRNHDRYNRCLSDYWWNQPVQYACGLEFAMVAELALFRLIACSGGFPFP